MIPLEEFRARIRSGDTDALIDDVLMADGAAHVSRENIAYLRRAISSRYRVDQAEVHVTITGSAKLGYSIIEKRKRGQHFPRYRPFGATSDIDVAVVSSPVFQAIWYDLTKRAHWVSRLPWNSGALGDYMVYGWLRPDCFPINVRLRKCDDWWDMFRRFSADPRFQRRKVRGGLFVSLKQLRMYQRRAVRDCSAAEALLR